MRWVTEPALLHLQFVGREPELEARCAVEAGADVVEVANEVAVRERHGSTLTPAAAGNTRAMIEIDFNGTVFQADDGDAWHWVELDEELTEVIDKFTGGPTGGWASVKVEATVGATTWNTSLFKSSDDTYLLPLKQPVRTAESIAIGDELELQIRL